MEESYKKEIKIITLGEGQVGKTSFIIKFIDDKFSFNYLTTLGLDFKQKMVKLPSGKEIRLKIFDTAGQERFRSITINYIKKADGIILIYDISNLDSFYSVERWMENIKSALGDKVPLILVGNKCDLENKRKVEKEMGIEKSNKYNIKFYETSCKDGINVNEVFFDLSEQIISNDNQKNKEESDETLEKADTFSINSGKHKSHICC